MGKENPASSHKKDAATPAPNKGSLPPLKKYGISTPSCFILSFFLLVVVVLLFFIEDFISYIGLESFYRMCKIVANFYAIFVGSLLSLATLRLIKPRTEQALKKWETLWMVLLLIVASVISIIGSLSDGKLWDSFQFFAYTIVSYLVSCWLSTDSRKTE